MLERGLVENLLKKAHVKRSERSHSFQRVLRSPRVWRIKKSDHRDGDLRDSNEKAPFIVVTPFSVSNLGAAQPSITGYTNQVHAIATGPYWS